MSTLVKFLLLAYLISWVIWLPLYLPYFGVDALPLLPLNHSWGAWGPLLAGIMVTGQEKGKSGLTALVKSSLNPFPIRFLLIALVSPFILLLIASLLSQPLNQLSFDFTKMGRTKEFPQFNLVTYFLYNLLFFGLGEEVGWKGIALPRLQQKYNALLASLVFTVFWALWHWPLFLYRPGYTSMDAVGIIGWAFSLLTGSILLTWLFNSSRGSIFICAVFHAAIDVAFVSDFRPAATINYLGMLITFWGIATIFIFGYRHLSTTERVKTHG